MSEALAGWTVVRFFAWLRDEQQRAVIRDAQLREWDIRAESRNGPPPKGYLSWDEYDADAADDLKVELRCRRPEPRTFIRTRP